MANGSGGSSVVVGTTAVSASAAWQRLALPALHTQRTRRRIPIRLLGVAIVAVALVYLIYTGLHTATVYYMTVSEFRQQPAATATSGKPVRVAGNVVPGSITRDAGTVRFQISDPSGQMPVVYKGVVPDIFGDNIQVVVEGHPNAEGAFQAGTLLAKCPSKFQAASADDVPLAAPAGAASEALAGVAA